MSDKIKSRLEMQIAAEMKFQADKADEQSSLAAMPGSASGPSYCASCGEWPASMTPNGLRCHLCACREHAAANPVPLPSNREMLKDLASIGVPGAADKLQRTPNDPSSPTAGGGSGGAQPK